MTDGSKPQPKCSFCGKLAAQVRQMVASEEAMICDECVRICRDALAEREIRGARLTGATNGQVLVQCALCWELFPTSHCMAVEDRGKLCTACVDAVLRASR